MLALLVWAFLASIMAPQFKWRNFNSHIFAGRRAQFGQYAPVSLTQERN